MWGTLEARLFHQSWLAIAMGKEELTVDEMERPVNNLNYMYGKQCVINERDGLFAYIIQRNND